MYGFECPTCKGRYDVTFTPAEKPDEPEPPESSKPRRFGGDDAPWCQPVAGLKRDPDSDNLVGKLWSHTGGNFNLNAFEWTVAVYDRAKATEQATLNVREPTWGNMGTGDKVPWNPKWRPPTDGDAYVCVLDYDTGHCWELWQTKYSGGTIRCGSAKLISKNIDGSGGPADVFKKSNVQTTSSACGIHELAGLVTREEMAAAIAGDRHAIRHALRCVWANPPKRFVAPAVKYPGGTAGSADRLPMGTRWAADLSDEEIADWVRRENMSRETAAGMTAIAVALRDYGAIGTDHGGKNGVAGAVWIEHDLSAHWGELGFKPDTRALHRLYQGKRDKFWIVAPPVWPGGDKNAVARY